MSRFSRHLAALGCAALIVLAACGRSSPTEGDTPPVLPPEFRVADAATASEGLATAAAADNGDIVVAWRTIAPLTPGAAQETLRVRRFDAGGARQGAELVVRPTSPSHITVIRLGLDRSGGFVVAWNEDEGTFGQRYDPVGTALTAAFPIGGGVLGDVAVTDAAGSFLAVWSEAVALPPGDADVIGRRFSAQGAPLGPPFRVNATRSGGNFSPRLAPGPGGAFFVVWTSFPPGAGRASRAVGQMVTAEGARMGAQLTLSADLTRRDEVSSLFAQSSGGFVVVSSSTPADARNYAVIFRRLDGGGVPAGPPVTAHVFPPNVVSGGVAAGRDAFLVVWSGSDAVGPQAQRYTAAGTPQGAPFAVTGAGGDGFGPSVAADPAGNFVVAWTKTQAGSLGGTVWLRRFAR